MLSEKDKIINDQLRKDSGEIDINSKLVSFLYELIRDHLPLGVVEQIVRNNEKHNEICYSNGWLAKYAENIASRLKDD